MLELPEQTRNHSNSHQRQAACALVDAIELAPIKEKLCLLAPNGEGWLQAAADHFIEEYRKFLKLNLKYPEHRIVPNRMVDTVWHTHILDTRKYAADCDVVFGRFLHHSPYFGLRGDSKERDEAFLQSSELYKQEFGAKPTSDFSNVCGADIRAAGCDGADIRAAGCDGADIRAAGCDPADIRAAGCDGADIRAAGCDGADIRAAGCDPADIRGGCDSADIRALCRDAGVIRLSGSNDGAITHRAISPS